MHDHIDVSNYYYYHHAVNDDETAFGINLGGGLILILSLISLSERSVNMSGQILVFTERM